MKTIIYIISILALTTACSHIPSSCPSRTDFIIATIMQNDSIVFPDQYDVLEEVFNDGKKENWYNGCFKLSHSDIITFILKNKLKIDTVTYGVFQPSGLGLLKKEKRELISMPELRKNNTEIYADTTQDKIYISKYY